MHYGFTLKTESECYASIVNKSNFRNNSEQNVQMFIFFGQNIMTLIKSDVKVVIQTN